MVCLMSAVCPFLHKRFRPSDEATTLEPVYFSVKSCEKTFNLILFEQKDQHILQFSVESSENDSFLIMEGNMSSFTGEPPPT